jgi:hypothetical protein
MIPSFVSAGAVFSRGVDLIAQRFGFVFYLFGAVGGTHAV